MIFDRLENAQLYNCLGKRFQEAFRYLRETDLSRAALEKVELDGKNLFATISEYDTKPREKGLWEAHRKYIDIQYIVSGHEQMGIAYVPALRVTKEYDTENDYLLLDGPGQFVKYEPGCFAIYFPHDAHMPNIAIEGPQKVRKVVVKVAVA